MRVVKSVVSIYTLLLVFLVACLIFDHSKVNAAPLPQAKPPSAGQTQAFSKHVVNTGKIVGGVVKQTAKNVANYVRPFVTKVRNSVGRKGKPAAGPGASPPKTGFPQPAKPAGAPAATG